MEESKLIEQWANTGLLQVFEGKESAAAQCLQAQLSLNEDAVEGNPQFKRISIPVLVRALSTSKAFRTNEFRALDSIDEHDVHFFKTRFKTTVVGELQEEADMTAALAEALRDEIDSLFSDRQRTTIQFGGIDLLPNNLIVLYYA